MTPKVFDIKLDIKKSTQAPVFEVVVGDYETNVFNISLMDGANPYDPTGLDVQIVFAKADRTTVVQDLLNGVVIDGQVIKCTLNSNTIAVPGKVSAEVRVLQDTKVLTSPRFSFFVRRPLLDDDIVKSGNEYPMLVKATEDAKAATQGAVDAAQSANTAADLANAATEAAGTAATNAQNAANSANTAEQARATAETGRVNAESARVTAEALREQGETNRNDSYIAAETERDNLYMAAESERDAQYAPRVTALETDLTAHLNNYAKLTQNNFCDKVRYVGHSGTVTYAPENTLEAYKIALLMGMWGAECDLGITSDGYLVLMHDYTVDRTTNGTGNVIDLTLAQIKALNIDYNLRGFPSAKVPTFEEYLIVCKEYGLYPYIEIKKEGHTNGMANALLATLEKYSMLKYCIVVSFGAEVLQYIRSLNPYINLGYVIQQADLITNENIAIAQGIGNCLLYPYGSTNITKAMVESCHIKGIPVACWTINDRTLANYLISIGVDMIITDALCDPNRNKKILTATFSTTDNGNTWTPTDPILKNNVIVTKVDNYTIEITFEGHLSQALMNLKPASIVQSFTNSSTKIDIQCYRTSTGQIRAKFYQGAAAKALADMPSYMHLYCEVVF